jgi:large subunit ribosomal protein L21
MFAVIRIGKSQFTVKPHDIISVDRLVGDVGSELPVTDVLFVDDDKHISIGTPLVQNVKVSAKIVAHDQGEKLQIRRYKSKVRYRKHTGFRAKQTKLEILSITTP